eukprot:2256327-Amphidinium_carterae.2
MPSPVLDETTMRAQRLGQGAETRREVGWPQMQDAQPLNASPHSPHNDIKRHEIERAAVECVQQAAV